MTTKKVDKEVICSQINSLVIYNQINNQHAKPETAAKVKLGGGGLIGYVKNKPLGTGQIISIDVLVIVMIIAVFHRKLI